MATGIRRRHSKSCRSHEGGPCNCNAGFEASVFDRSGQRIRKSFATAAEAKAWRSDMSLAVRRGKSIVPSKVTLREAAAEFMRLAEEGQVRARNGRPYSPSTLRGYRRQLDKYLLPDLGALKLTEIRRRDVQDLADRHLAQGFSASSIHNALAPLRAVYRRAVQREVVAESPLRALVLPRAEGGRERIATAQEAAELIEALPEGDRALWACAFYAGLRRGELQALRWEDVDLGKSEIHVRRSWDEKEGAIDPKSAAGKRKIPLLGVLHDFLDELKLRTGREGEALVFGHTASEPFAISSVRYRALTAWRGREPIAFHECRHTFASLMIHAGVNAKALSTFMGHSNISITLDTYGHLMPGSRDEARALMDSYLATATEEVAG
jgi:integrase